MPISSFDSTGRSGASRLPTRTCSVAATSRSTGPVIRRAKTKDRTKATTSAAKPTRTCVFWIWRKGASSRSRLRRATAAPTSWSEDERIGRTYATKVSPPTSSGSGPIVLPWRSTAWTRSSRRAIAASAALPSGPIVDAASAAFAGSGGLAASARKTTCVFRSCSRLRATSSLIWKAAAMTPTRRVPPSSTGAATTL